MRYLDDVLRYGRTACMIGAVVACLAMMMPAHALYSDEATTFGRRQLIEAVSTSDLDFGKLAIMGFGGRVELKPDGHRVLTGGLEGLGGTWAAARITVEGRPNSLFTVLDHQAIPMTSKNGRKIILKRLLCEPSRLGRLDAYGRAEIKCGGVLRVSKNVRQGTYRAHVRLLVIAF